MDRGEVFRQHVSIRPLTDGSFLVKVSNLTFSESCEYGFTNLSDLLNWLVANAQAAAAVKVDQLTEAQIVPNQAPAGIGRLMSTVIDGLDGSKLVRASDGSIRRTTAAEIIREREAREMAATFDPRVNAEPPRSA